MKKEKSEIEELREFLSGQEKLEVKEATIINDKTQFSIRIPRKIARMFNLKGGEKFEFEPKLENNKLILIGKLKNDVDKK